jgi:hypothetical protein
MTRSEHVSNFSAEMKRNYRAKHGWFAYFTLIILG